MIDVASDHASDQVEMLGISPEHTVLVDNCEAHFVTEVEHGRRSGIVRTADGVETIFLELLELVAPKLIGDGGTYAGVIQMKVTSAEFGPDAVEQETPLRIEVDRTYTYLDVISIQKALDSIVAFVKAGPQSIEIRRVHRPQSRRSDFEFHQGIILIGKSRGDGTSVGIEKRLGNEILRLSSYLSDAYLRHDGAFGTVGIEPVLLQGDSIRLDGGRRGLVKIYIPVNAGALVEPAFLQGGVSSHCDEVLLSETDILRHIIDGARISAPLMSHIYAVAEHFRIAEDALELDQNASAPVGFGDSDLLAVPAYGRLRILPPDAFVAVAVARFLGVRQVDHPVVRKTDLLPGGIVEIRRGRTLVILVGHYLRDVREILGAVGEIPLLVPGIAERKLPVVVDQDTLADAVAGQCRRN